ncbi:MAG: TetR/AcrR family transcriptional regulator [Methanobrevibacter thaueri]|uniref:TetR/AcrR family transcriptional regulator n=1 Tax=Methanobrevibacter thaueri TaxID=190975 RepID=A0A8T3V7C4_9EURY|nr:TetR/AcrR family transcriptional regulator [Methanobrevibacter thaueri]MBE6502201.1 TetR/AcrR family transcriptional regulator [Methanobrevibacter thaueri]
MKIELDNTEEKIVRATFDIIQKEGVSKATTKKIAAEAGVNEVTVFRKFTNKQNLVEITKDYHFQILIDKLDKIFDFREDEETEEYLRNNFIELANLPEAEFSIIKVALEDVRAVSDKKLLIAQITDTILDKFEEFFTLQIDEGRIRKVNPRVLGTLCYSITFQSLVLWKIYSENVEKDGIDYSTEFLDILYNGIRVE